MYATGDTLHLFHVEREIKARVLVLWYGFLLRPWVMTKQLCKNLGGGIKLRPCIFTLGWIAGR